MQTKGHYVSLQIGAKAQFHGAVWLKLFFEVPQWVRNRSLSLACKVQSGRVLLSGFQEDPLHVTRANAGRSRPVYGRQQQRPDEPEQALPRSHAQADL